MARAPSFILTAIPSDVSRVFRACTYSLNCACGLICSSVVTAFLKDSSALAMSSRFWTNWSNFVLKSVKMQSNSDMSNFLKSRSLLSLSLRFKVVSLQVVSLQHELIRYTHKVDSLHILGRFASNSISPKVDSLHFRYLI